MPKGGKIINVIKGQIGGTFYRMYELDPKVTAKEVQAEVNTILREKNPTLGHDWPGVSAVGKVITEIKKKMTELGPDPADRPWSLGSLVKYPIPPEALPIVMWVFRKRVELAEQERLPEDKERLAPNFTIREALWIGRLYTIFPDWEELMTCASGVALRERVCQLLPKDFPNFTTRDLDMRLTEPDYRKIIEDAGTGRTQSIQAKQTSRDMLRKAKRTPSTWPAGEKAEFTDVDIPERKKEAQNER